MLTLQARALLKVYADDVKDHLERQGIVLTDKILLQMDDGVHETTGWRIVYSSFCWNFQRVFAKTPLTVKCLLTGRVTMSSHTDLMNHGYWETFEIYGMHRSFLEYLDRLTAKSTNVLRNYVVTDLQAYVVSLSLDDYVELVELAPVKKELEMVNNTKSSVARCHDNISRILMTSDEVKHNIIVQFVRSKFINMGQVLQCIGPKGFQAGTDSRYYDTPILNSFLTGLTTIYESAVESTSATKAIKFAKDHVEKGEYFQRKMHLGGFPVLGLHHGDCGTTKTMEVTLTEELIYSFEGKEITDESGRQRYIWLGDKDLVGQTVQMRSVVHCRMFSKQHVCSRCFGYMANSIVDDSNLGLVSNSELCRDASQSLLSVKHNDFTRIFMEIVLGATEQMHLAVNTEDGSVIRLQEKPGCKNMRLVVDARYLRNITDVLVIDDVERLTPTATTSIHGVSLCYTDADGYDVEEYLTVAQGAQMASFSTDMLRYIRKHRWSVLGGNRYVFDMKKWEFDLPVFALPMQTANMLEYIRCLEVFIRSTGKTTNRGGVTEIKRLVDADNIEDGLLAFNQLVSSMLSVNIAHQEIAIASMTAISETDSRFPPSPAEGVVMPYETLIRDRSISGYYGYEHHERIYGHIRTYLNRNRMSHPLDWIFGEIDYGESSPTLQE